jgi:hypothetical protein
MARDVVALYLAVAKAFEDMPHTAMVAFGSREKARQINQGGGTANRVVIEPLEGDVVGELLPPRGPGANPLRTATLRSSATVYVWGYDSSAPTNEAMQYRAARELLRHVVSALWSEAAGEVQLGRVQRVKPERGELLHGVEWKFTITLIDDLEAIDSAEAVIVPDAIVTTTLELQ